MVDILRKRDNSRTVFPEWFGRVELGMVVGLARAWQAASPQEADPEMQLEAALHQEIVRGDLPGAIAQYRSILAQPVKDRALAARALLQIGQCLEKQGQGKEAHNTYRRVGIEFADQPAIAAEARAAPAASQ